MEEPSSHTEKTSRMKVLPCALVLLLVVGVTAFAVWWWQRETGTMAALSRSADGDSSSANKKEPSNAGDQQPLLQLDPRVKDALRDLIQLKYSGDVSARTKALVTIEKLHDGEGAVSVFKRLLKDTDALVRQESAMALGRRLASGSLAVGNNDFSGKPQSELVYCLP